MSKEIKVVYPTSANPPTWGHADILHRAAQKFDHIYWVIGRNPDKLLSFSIEDRIAMMQEYIDYYQLKNVTIEHFEGATARFAHSVNADFILRGLRNTSDFHYELELATGYRGIDKDIETVCFFAKPHFATISSTLIRQLVMVDENIDQYVLPSVAKRIRIALGKESNDQN